MVDLAKRTGTVSLRKGEAPLDVAAKSTITVTMGWTNPRHLGRTKKLDYDLMAHIVYDDGTSEDIDFDKLASRDGSVQHQGDLKSGGSTEVIKFKPSQGNKITFIGFSCYSAFENGRGSFADAKVDLTIDNGGGSVISIPALESHRDRYTLYFATVDCRPYPNIKITPVEDYSASGSEKRPVLLASGRCVMDAGIEKISK
jgi:stress response protein SCP2